LVSVTDSMVGNSLNLLVNYIVQLEDLLGTMNLPP
jgi:hypothetical protein